jgi:flagellar protein FlaG
MDVRLDTLTHRQTTTPSPANADSARKPPTAPDTADTQAVPDAKTKQAREAQVTHLHDTVQHVQRELHFRVDEATGQTVVRVVEPETGKLIRQIPDQNALELHAFLESASGLLVQDKA